MKSIAIAIAVAVVVVVVGTSACQGQAPEDGGRYTVIVVTQPQPTPTARQLVEWLANDPHFTELMSKVHYQHFDTTNPLYQRRYAEQLPEAPVIALVRPDGGVEYKASGGNIPATAAMLHAEMQFYHNLHPYYPPQQTEAWPDTCHYAESRGFPIRDSRQIVSPYQQHTDGLSAIAWTILSAVTVLVLCVVGVLVYLLWPEPGE
ncbi:hypothetical protein [Rosistilla oblonga]|uniref:hypothetical protein n=1 Tax=Rosistilla oblonga TaxID=2527990 RepID=UPI003A96F974